MYQYLDLFKKLEKNSLSAIRTTPERLFYDIPKVVSDSLPLAMTCTNISKDFEKNDTCPYNACIFINDDFLSSFVTDHSEPANLASEPPYQDRPEAILTVSVCQPVIG